MSERDILPSYLAVQNALEQEEMHLSPAELHGLICGVLCGYEYLKKEGAVKMVLDLLAEEGDLSPRIRTMAAQLILISAKNLQSDELSFQLLLPDEETSLEIRLQALGEWCQHFITGLGLSGLKWESGHNAELSEALTDVIAITQCDYRGAIKTESSEIAYNELLEYVRLVTIMIYIDSGGKIDQMNPQNSGVLH